MIFTLSTRLEREFPPDRHRLPLEAKARTVSGNCVVSRDDTTAVPTMIPATRPASHGALLQFRKRDE